MHTLAATTLLFENTAGQILTDPARYLRTYWLAKPRTLADTQEFLGQLLRALQQYGASKVLINQVDMLPFSPEEQAWVNQEWLPLAITTNYRFGAVVVATNLYARLATAGITTSPHGLPMRYRSFDREDQAIAWLEQQ